MRVFAAMLFLAILLASTPGVDAGESGLPRLGDHQFVPVRALTEPFMTTFLRMGVGLGWSLNAVQPVYSILDSAFVGTVESDQLLTGVGATYQQQVKNWLVARVQLDVVGRLGTDTSSLLNDGITGALAYELGWMLRVYRSRSVLVSGSVSLESASATFVNIRDWASYGVELARSRRSLSGTGGAHAAWGIDRRFGLLGSLALSYGEAFDGIGKNEWYGDARLALSYDSREDLQVPVGFAVAGGYDGNNVNAASGQGTWFWDVRVAAIGRDDFSTGVELRNTYVDVRQQPDRVQFLEILLEMRYYY